MLKKNDWDSEAFKESEKNGFVFSEDKKTLLKYKGPRFTREAVIPLRLTPLAINAFEIVR